MSEVFKPIYGEIWANAGEVLAPGNDKIATGWIQEMMPYQYENYLQNRTDVALSYLFQKGIAEWSADQEYTANKSVVTYGGQLYMATATVTNILPTVAASWKKLSATFGANGAIPIAFGGTGATTAADARTNLGIGSAATVDLPTTNGIVTKLANNSLVARTITGTAGYITVTNGDAVSGNPTITVGENVAKTDADAAWSIKTSIKIPSGTSSERGVGAPGRIRFNMESGVYEGYDNVGWNPIGSIGTLDVQNFSGDGVKTSFTMSATPRAENNTQVYFNGVYQQKNSYSLVGSDLVFDESPALGIEIEVVTVSSVAIGTTTAGQTSIVDSGNYYNSTNVEGALAEIGNKQSRTALSYATKAEAEAAAATMSDGQLVEAQDADGQLSLYYVQSGALEFKDYVPDVIRMQSYDALRTYTGKSWAVEITGQNISGVFVKDAGDFSSADNGCTIIVGAGGSRWRRDVDRPNYVNVLWCEGVSQGRAVDIVPSLQKAVDWLVSKNMPWEIEFPAGEFRMNSELSLENATTRWAIQCKAERSCTIYYGAIGASKKLFKGGPNTGMHRIAGFSIQPVVTDPVSRRQHPIPLYFPNASRPDYYKLTFDNGGNTAIWTSRTYNAFWNDLDIFFTGYAIPHKSIPLSTYYTSTENSNVIGVSVDTFAAEDIGKDVILSAPSSLLGAMSARISTFTDARTVVLDRPVPWSSNAANARKISFMHVRGSITSGSNIFTSSPSRSGDVFFPSDVGRYIYVSGAGEEGRVLVSTITQVISSTQVLLANTASVSVSNGQWTFTPAVFLGSYASDGSINDQVIKGIRIEGWRGWGLLTERGLHVHLSHLKTHGRTWDGFEDCGVSTYGVVCGSTDHMTITGWEHEFVASSTDSGAHLLAGPRPNLQVSKMTVNSCLFNQSLFDFSATSNDGSGLNIGSINFNSAGCKYMPSLVRTTTNGQIGRIKSANAVQSPPGIHNSSLQGAPFRTGEPIFVNDDSAVSFSPAYGAGLCVATVQGSISTNGAMYFSNAGNGAGAKAFGGDNFAVSSGVLSGVTGEDGKLTTSFHQGKIYIENRSGSARWVSVMVAG